MEQFENNVRIKDMMKHFGISQKIKKIMNKCDFFVRKHFGSFWKNKTFKEIINNFANFKTIMNNFAFGSNPKANCSFFFEILKFKIIHICCEKFGSTFQHFQKNYGMSMETSQLFEQIQVRRFLFRILDSSTVWGFQLTSARLVAYREPAGSATSI